MLLENLNANDKDGLSEMKILLTIYIDSIFGFSFCGHKGKDYMIHILEEFYVIMSNCR